MIDFREALLARVAPAALLLVLAACSSPPSPPTEALLAAEAIITQAEQASVAHYTSPELTRARVSLAAARSAAGKGEMFFALQLAERARFDARLAIARTELASAGSDANRNARRRGAKPASGSRPREDGSEASVGLWRSHRLELTVANVQSAKR